MEAINLSSVEFQKLANQVTGGALSTRATHYSFIIEIPVILVRPHQHMTDNFVLSSSQQGALNH